MNDVKIRVQKIDRTLSDIKLTEIYIIKLLNVAPLFLSVLIY